MTEVGTLKELDVKPGDVLVCVWAVTSGVFTVGKTYRMTGNGLECDSYIPQLSTASTFRVISRAAYTPKLWRDMTDAEKGALLLAFHNDKKCLEIRRNGKWVYCEDSTLDNNIAYRIRPEPKVEVVTVRYQKRWVTIMPFYDGYTHRITFTTIDGKPDCASIKMEAI